MKIYAITQNYNYNKNSVTKPTFQSKFLVETIGKKHLGLAQNGFLGKVQVLKLTGEEAFLNLYKSNYSKYEIYTLKDNFDREIGKVELTFNKYDSWGSPEDKDHVFVSELKNYSDSKTPYYIKGLDEYKHIGTRLLQVAQRRSYEEGCDGNIELVAKNRKEVLEFYKRLGFEQPANITRFGNPYRLHLASSAKDGLCNKYGGL